MLQAMNTGHEGSLSTAHANSTRHLLWRLETMAMMSDVDLPAAHIRTQVCAADRRDRASRAAAGWPSGGVGDRRGRGDAARRARRDAAVPVPAAGMARTAASRRPGAVPEVVGDAREPRRVARARTCSTRAPIDDRGSRAARGGGRSWPARPSACAPAIGRRSPDRAGRVAGCLGAARVRRSPGLDWPWWPVAGAVVGGLVGGVIAAVARRGRRQGRARPRCARRRDARVAATRRRAARGRRPVARRRHARGAVGDAGDRVRRQGRRAAARAHAGRIVDSVSLGGSLDDALEAWAREVGTDDARLVVGVLDAPSAERRGPPARAGSGRRHAARADRGGREVRALTAQARLSGAILGLLPIGFFAFLWMTSRGRHRGSVRLADRHRGDRRSALVLECIAFLWIRSLLEVA